MESQKIGLFLKSIGLGDYDFSQLTGGYVNNTFLLTKGSEKIILKEYLGIRTFEQILGEARFLDYLSSKGSPVPLPKKISGNLIHEFEGAIMVLSEYMGGSEKNAEELSSEEINDAIKKVYEIHEASRGLKIEGIKKRRDMFTFDFEDWVDTLLEGRQVPSFFLETQDLKNKLKEQLGGEDSLEKFPIHNDLVLKNLKFEDSKLCAILDFDDFCEGTRVSDFVNLALDSCIINNRVDLRRLKDFVSKYDDLGHFSDKEIDFIGTLLIHRLVMYVYFIYYNFFYKGNKESLSESERYYQTLKEILGKEIKHNGKTIRFGI